jgi:Domain of unknown function (DUF892)
LFHGEAPFGPVVLADDELPKRILAQRVPKKRPAARNRESRGRVNWPSPTLLLRLEHGLFLHTLKDIYYAEKQIYKNLPKMAKSAKSPELKRAFEKHREETEHHVERLETIFDQCGVAARAIRCEAMDGILEEAKDVMAEIGDGQVHDAGRRRKPWSTTRSRVMGP